MPKDLSGLIDAASKSALTLAFAFALLGLWLFKRISDKGQADIPRETRKVHQVWGGRLIAMALGLAAGHFVWQIMKEIIQGALGCS